MPQVRKAMLDYFAGLAESLRDRGVQVTGLPGESNLVTIARAGGYTLGTTAALLGLLWVAMQEEDFTRAETLSLPITLLILLLAIERKRALMASPCARRGPR